MEPEMAGSSETTRKRGAPGSGSRIERFHGLSLELLKYSNKGLLRKDFLPMVVSDLGDLLVHGVTMRPSSPTGVGRIGGVPVLLLPGNPVSCLVAYDAFAGPVIRTMTGLPLSMPYQTERRALAGRLVSRIGRTDYARVAVGGDGVRPVAIAGASVLSSVTAADGFVIVPAASEGFPEGTEVEVHRYGTLRW